MQFNKVSINLDYVIREVEMLCGHLPRPRGEDDPKENVAMFNLFCRGKRLTEYLETKKQKQYAKDIWDLM